MFSLWRKPVYMSESSAPCNSVCGGGQQTTVAANMAATTLGTVVQGLQYEERCSGLLETQTALAWRVYPSVVIASHLQGLAGSW
jgi:hypothetical protein